MPDHLDLARLARLGRSHELLHGELEAAAPHVAERADQVEPDIDAQATTIRGRPDDTGRRASHDCRRAQAGLEPDGEPSSPLEDSMARRPEPACDTEIRRGLASSATGMVSVRTPSL